MSRRRPSFPAFVRRRWRALGLILVLLAGSLLVLVVTDRGHDPQWDARGPGPVDQAVVSPDGARVYALLREHGNVSRLQARDGRTGALLWESPLNATRALLAAGNAEVAVATDFPRAFLTVYGNDGSPGMQVALEGNPQALAVDGPRVALALRNASNPVLVFENGTRVGAYGFASFVDTLDARAGRLAVGTGAGLVVVLERDGKEALNVSLPMNVHSLRLSQDGTALLVGGYGLGAGDLTGQLAFLDETRNPPLAWTRNTTAGVGLVDLDGPGVLALAVEESLPQNTLSAYDAGTGAPRWTRTAEGVVPHDDAGQHGSAAISPDGRFVVVSTLRGPVDALSATTGNPQWTFESDGSTAVGFARDDAHRFVDVGRLGANGPYDTLFLFDTTSEPLRGRLPEMAALLTAGALAAAAAILGVGYWRVRRPY